MTGFFQVSADITDTTPEAYMQCNLTLRLRPIFKKDPHLKLERYHLCSPPFLPSDRIFYSDWMLLLVPQHKSDCLNGHLVPSVKESTNNNSKLTTSNDKSRQGATCTCSSLEEERCLQSWLPAGIVGQAHKRTNKANNEGKITKAQGKKESYSFPYTCSA